MPLALNTTNPALIEAFPEDAEIPGTAYSWPIRRCRIWIGTRIRRIPFRPSITTSTIRRRRPMPIRRLPGFTQHLDAGSQVISLSHTQIVRSNLSVTETFGFIREKAYSTLGQPFTPAQLGTAVRAA